MIQNKNYQFFKLLKTTLSSNQIISEDDDTCLISHQPLNDTKIKLMCGHSFNYEAIFKELYNQKYHMPKTEIQKVLNNEIKCPYCRKIQKGILPYVSGFEKVKYVNSPASLIMMCNNCIYIFKSGKNKGNACNKKCIDEYCSRCLYYIKKRAKKNSTIHKDEDSNANSYLCNATIKSGLRKGLLCRHPAKFNGKCGIHKNK